MRVIYYETSNFIEHSENLVDLEEYRRRSRTEERPERQAEAQDGGQESAFRPIVLSLDRKARRRLGWERRAMILDMWASVGVVCMTIGVLLWMML